MVSTKITCYAYLVSDQPSYKFKNCLLLTPTGILIQFLVSIIQREAINSVTAIEYNIARIIGGRKNKKKTSVQQMHMIYTRTFRQRHRSHVPCVEPWQKKTIKQRAVKTRARERQTEHRLKTASNGARPSLDWQTICTDKNRPNSTRAAQINERLPSPLVSGKNGTNSRTQHR